MYERFGFRPAGHPPPLLPRQRRGRPDHVARRRSTARSARLILALETSCDDTCAAVVEGRRIRSNIDLLAGGGPRALRRRRPRGRLAPPPRARQPGRRGGARRGRRRARGVDALAVTRGPGLIGALLVGVSTAKALAAAAGKPLTGVDHLHGHVAANFLEPDPLEPPVPLPDRQRRPHAARCGPLARGLRGARRDARRRRRRGARQGGPPARARLSGRPGDRARGGARGTPRHSSCRWRWPPIRASTSASAA